MRLAARAGIPYTGFHFSCPSQFTRTFLGADFMLAGKSACRKVRRERHLMSKKSCEAAESIEDALLRMARVNWRRYPRMRSAAIRNLSLTRLAARAPKVPYCASTTISSSVSSARCIISSMQSFKFSSWRLITARFGLVTGCFATKIVQQSSNGRIDVS